MSKLFKLTFLTKGSVSTLQSWVPSPIYQWWQQQSVRDQKALKLLAWLSILVLFYITLWQPTMQAAEIKTQKLEKQEQRQEQALLRYYERLNQYGTSDFSPFDEWLKNNLSRYQISVIQHQKSKNPEMASAQKKTDASLLFRYQQQQQASDFLIAAQKRVEWVDLQVDQNKREISFRYYARF